MVSKKVGLTELSQSLPRKFLAALLSLVVFIVVYAFWIFLSNFNVGDKMFFTLIAFFFAFIAIFTYGVISSLIIDFLIDNLSLRFFRFFKLIMYIIFGMLGNFVIGVTDLYNPLPVFISLIFFGIDELLQIRKKVV